MTGLSPKTKAKSRRAALPRNSSAKGWVGQLRNREEVSVSGPNERPLSSWWWGDNRGGGCLEDPHLAEAAQEVLGQWKHMAVLLEEVGSGEILPVN